ncbi:MAG: RNA methyltransferase [Planctomycetes bacterium]|nr:RNA methyltransferase [Planctomycetota bacterium]
MSLPAEPIRSSANPLLKRVRAVAAGRGEGEILLEGDRLVDDARRAGLELSVVLVAEERVERLAELTRAGIAARAVAGELLASASSLEHSSGCLALARQPAARTLDALPSSADALLVVAAGIQDPGNLGALARTAEAAGASALLVTSGGCRPWNPKALRGSMGSLLRLPVFELEARRTSVDALSGRGFRHVCARTRGGTAHERFDWAGKVALWLTAEAGGFPGELAAASERFAGVSIAMGGAAESLNVTAAAAVLLFAAGRTRNAR